MGSESSAEKLMRLSREWQNLRREMEEAGAEVSGEEGAEFRERLEAAGTQVGEALRPALVRASHALTHAQADELAPPGRRRVLRRVKASSGHRSRSSEDFHSLPVMAPPPRRGAVGLTRRELAGAVILAVCIVAMLGCVVVLVSNLPHGGPGQQSTMTITLGGHEYTLEELEQAKARWDREHPGG